MHSGSNTFEHQLSAVLAAVHNPGAGMARLQNLDIQYEDLALFADNKFIAVDYYHALETLELDDRLGKKARLLMEVRRHEAVSRENQLLSQLEQVANIFARSGIDFVLLKGAALIAAGYFDFQGRRRVSDIDFLVRREDLDKAYDALVRANYACKLSLGPNIDEYWNSKHLPPFSSPDHYFRLECHQTPFETTFTFDIPVTSDDIFRHAEKVQIGAQYCKVPCPEHILLSAFFHSEIVDVNGFAGLDNYRSFLDVSAIVDKRGDELDWDLITKKLLEKRYTRYFENYLMRVHHYYDKRVPESLLRSRQGSSRPSHFDYIPASLRRLMVSFIVHAREVVRAVSSAGRKERRAIARFNPENWKYLPLYKQMLTPRLLLRRMQYLFSRPV